MAQETFTPWYGPLPLAETTSYDMTTETVIPWYKKGGPKHQMRIRDKFGNWVSAYRPHKIKDVFGVSKAVNSFVDLYWSGRYEPLRAQCCQEYICYILSKPYKKKRSPKQKARTAEKRKAKKQKIKEVEAWLGFKLEARNKDKDREYTRNSRAKMSEKKKEIVRDKNSKRMQKSRRIKKT